MRIVILHDRISSPARPDELDALTEIQVISTALDSLGHDHSSLAFSMDLPAVAAELTRLAPDVIFNMVESVESHGRLIYLAPALLDVLNLPYTGVPTEAMFLTSNKLLAKRLLHTHNLPTPSWYAGTSSSLSEPGVQATGRASGFRTETNGTYIIKSVWEDASLGLDDDALVRAETPEELQSELRSRADRLGGEAFAEAYIDGREFNLALLADRQHPQVLPPAEIRFLDYPDDKPRIVGYTAKWNETSFEYTHTPSAFDFPKTDVPLLEQLQDLAARCWHIFGLRGYARVDFRVDSAGRPWILEVNPNPCLSPDAGFVAAARRKGMRLEDVIDRLLVAARRPAPCPSHTP